jgi:hypothetical protein
MYFIRFRRNRPRAITAEKDKNLVKSRYRKAVQTEKTASTGKQQKPWNTKGEAVTFLPTSVWRMQTNY